MRSFVGIASPVPRNVIFTFSMDNKTGELFKYVVRMIFFMDRELMSMIIKILIIALVFGIIVFLAV